jgi:dihydrofolate reductase
MAATLVGRWMAREDGGMGAIVVFESLSLDGVMQAPGRPDEDTRGGFTSGGWAGPFADESMGEATGRHMASSGGLLLGRRTYEDFYEVWPKRTDNPYTEVLNASTKYVASRTLQEPLPWQNSVLARDAVATVTELKPTLDKDLTILGSGELVRSLMEAGLVDRFVLLVHPLVLGRGTRLFPDTGSSHDLRLVDSVTTATGVVIGTYEPR